LKTGRIAPGRTADLVVARKKAPNPWDAFFAVDPEDILLVLRRGAVVMCDASVDGFAISGPWSVVRLGTTEKRVAEDVPGLVAGIRECGVETNIPIVG
jgi:hypothetical protein